MKRMLSILALLFVVFPYAVAAEKATIHPNEGASAYSVFSERIGGNVSFMDCMDIRGICRESCIEGENQAGSITRPDVGEINIWCGLVTIEQAVALDERGNKISIDSLYDGEVCCVRDVSYVGSPDPLPPNPTVLSKGWFMEAWEFHRVEAVSWSIAVLIVLVVLIMWLRRKRS